MSRSDREPFSKEDAELALAVLLEPLAAGARVLWAAEPGAGAERLAACAASVEALAGPRRSRQGGRRAGAVRTRGLPAPGERWDLVVMPELEDIERLADGAAWLAPTGAFVASFPATPASYERLESELARLFAPGGARIVGQTRFAGFALIDFAQADGTEVGFDGTGMEETEPPLRWIALAGPAALSAPLSPYLVVQTAAGSGTPEARPIERAAPERAALERELDAARGRVELAEKRLEQAQRDIARSSQKLDEMRHQLGEAQGARSAEVDSLRRELRTVTDRAAAEARRSLSPSEAREIEDGYVELEDRLRSQGGELTALRSELERRSQLVRDLVEELAEARRGGSPVPPAATPMSVETLSELDRLRAQVAGLLRRVADAEGQRAAAQFAVDEQRGRLERSEADRQRSEAERQRLASERHQLDAERARLAAELNVRRTPSSSAAGEVESAVAQARAELASAFASEREAMEQRRAEFDGRLRGLGARLAETEEFRRLAEARVLLLEVDLGGAREDARTWLAQLEQTREQLALARMAPPSNDARREGELLGTLSRTREALLAAQEERDRLIKELGRARATLVAAEQEAMSARGGSDLDLAVLRSELEVIRASEASGRTALLELREAYEARLSALDALEGERNGLRLRLADTEAALGAAADRVEALGHERDAVSARLLASREALRRFAEGAARDGALSDGGEDDAAHLALLEAERTEAQRVAQLLGELERDLEVLRRERDAQDARAEAAEAALADERGEAGKLGKSLGELARDLELARHAREAAEAALAAAHEAERQRTSASIARVHARDALVARLQSELALGAGRRDALRAEIAALEERLRRESEERAAAAVVHEVQRAEEGRERRVLEDSARAAEREVGRERDQRARIRDVLSEARGSLGRLVEGLRAPEERGAPFAPESILRDEIAALRRDLDDRGLVLRTLTGQVEERDARLRALEGGPAAEARRALEVALRDATDREGRLVRELELAAERRTAMMEREVEVRRLEKELEVRDGQLMALEGRLAQSERSQDGLRAELAKLGTELDGVLARAGADAPAATLERLAEVVRSLRR